MSTVARQPKKLMIMAAGTGGHIFPGIAIAQTMQARGWDVSWMGTRQGMENQILAQTNLTAKTAIPLETIDFTGMRGKGLWHTLTGAVRLVQSFFACRRILAKNKPDVVMGMGGYVTVPGGFMAALRGTPLVLMNADAGLLLSNKALLPLASKLLFGLPGFGMTMTAKMQQTGNPLRAEICQLPAPELRFQGRTGALRIVVIGGSLGARVLNQVIPAALALIAPEQRPVITHQSGKANAEALRQRYAELGVEAQVLDFIHDMPACYAQADLVICRAGAITVSELTAVGVASMLIPLVASSTSHQKQNAEWMAQQKAALHLPQSNLNASDLAQQLASLERAECLQMAKQSYALGQPKATQAIAEILEELV